MYLVITRIVTRHCHVRELETKEKDDEQPPMDTNSDHTEISSTLKEQLDNIIIQQEKEDDMSPSSLSL